MTTEIKKEAPNETAILAKANKGEKLTEAEEEFVAGLPNAERSPEPAPAEKEDEEPGAEAAPEPESPGEEADAEKPADEEPAGEEAPEPTGAEAEKTPEEKTKERRALVDAELEKPDAETDLSKFTPTEVGLYWDLKKERRRRQKAEATTRELQFKELAKSLKEELKPEAKSEDEDPLAGRDDEDVVSVADVKKLLAKAKKEEPSQPKPIITVEQVRAQKLSAKTNLEAKGLKDFDEVTAYADWALQGDEDAREILIEAAKAGENILEKTYWLVKGSKHWAKIDAAIKKSKPGAKAENEDRARRIENNAGKVKTTGSASGGGQPGTISKEKVAAMTIADFKKLSAKEQDWILRNYGSDPNYSV